MLNSLADAAVEGHQVLTENIGLTETTPKLVTTSKSANTEDEKTGESDDPETSTGGFTKQQHFCVTKILELLDMLISSLLLLA